MTNSNTKAYLALTVVCVVWGTTYLAMRIGVATFPAFLFSSIRQIIAGILLFGILLISGNPLKISGKDLTRQAIAGSLMIALGNGLIGWSEKYIPSGLAALIISAMPLYVVFISYISGVDRQPVNNRVIAGMLLGFVGIVLIFRDNFADLANPDYLIGVAVAFFASLCWAAGTVYTKYNRSSADAFVNAAIQLTSGGIVLLILSLLFDDLSQIHSISANSIWALGYLIVFGSLTSFGCYLYALDHLPAGLASIYAYINPLIAILLGYFILDERITWITGLALIAIVSGVFWINKGYTLLNETKPGAGKAALAK